MGKKRVLILMLCLIIGGYGVFRYYLGSQLEKANTALSAGDLKQAELGYMKVSRLPFSQGRGHGGLGCIALLQGRQEDAKNHFQLVLANNTPFSKPAVASALKLFFDRGAYSEGSIYLDFLLQWKKNELNDFNVDFAMISLGNFELAKARSFLSNATETQKQTPHYKKTLELADEYEANREIPIILDRKGETIMAFSLVNNTYEYTIPQLFLGWPSQQEYGKHYLDQNDWKNSVTTQIDLDLQRLAHQSMRGYQGSMILMDPSTGDILAAYGTEGFSPFLTKFEPGSVIKVLTYASLLEHQGNPELYAPLTYPSHRVIDGKIFYDWHPHGKLNSIDEGMAVSCNLMFAQIGIDLGWSTIRRNLNRFFNRKTEEILLGKMVRGEITTTPKNDFELGRTSIGLEHIETTTYGLAQIPAAIANNGILCSPRLLVECRNIQGKVYKKAEKVKETKMFSTSTAKALIKAMKAAVEFERGTARRARVDGIDIAVKTGTAGDRPFNSIIIGILNPANPKLVFAFELYHGGKCEINGALVAARLQSQIKVIAPQYLN